MHTPDPDILARAAAEGRIVLTHDRNTMTGFAATRVNAGQPMPGLFCGGSPGIFRTSSQRLGSDGSGQRDGRVAGSNHLCAVVRRTRRLARLLCHAESQACPPPASTRPSRHASSPAQPPWLRSSKATHGDGATRCPDRFRNASSRDAAVALLNDLIPVHPGSHQFEHIADEDSCATERKLAVADGWISTEEPPDGFSFHRAFSHSMPTRRACIVASSTPMKARQGCSPHRTGKMVIPSSPHPHIPCA